MLSLTREAAKMNPLFFIHFINIPDFQDCELCHSHVTVFLLCHSPMSSLERGWNDRMTSWKVTPFNWDKNKSVNHPEWPRKVVLVVIFPIILDLSKHHCICGTEYCRNINGVPVIPINVGKTSHWVIQVKQSFAWAIERIRGIGLPTSASKQVTYVGASPLDRVRGGNQTPHIRLRKSVLPQLNFFYYECVRNATQTSCQNLLP